LAAYKWLKISQNAIIRELRGEIRVKTGVKRVKRRRSRPKIQFDQLKCGGGIGDKRPYFGPKRVTHLKQNAMVSLLSAYLYNQTSLKITVIYFEFS